MTLSEFALPILTLVFAASQCQLTGAASGCPSAFKEMCECGLVPYGPQKKITYVTNCTQAGFDNTIMLRSLPPMTEVLIFTGNEIRDLPLNIFGQDIVYDKLHTIDFTDNHIQSIKGKTFHNVANVTKLILNDNDLYIVSKDHHPRMFSNFVNLRELHLKNAFTEKVKAGDYFNNLVEIFENSSLNNLRVLNLESNEIHEIHENEFCSLPALEELYLADNHLNDVKMNFSCMKNLRVIDVANNSIRYLSDETIHNIMNNLESTQRFKLTLNLVANPFQCDCKMVHTYLWMQNTLTNLTNIKRLYCYKGFPPNIGKNIVSIFANDLQCLSSFSKLSYHSSASIVLFVGLACIVVLLSGLVYKNWVHLYTFVRRTFQPIRSKFHYVSLEKRHSTMDV